MQILEHKIKHQHQTNSVFNIFCFCDEYIWELQNFCLWTPLRDVTFNIITFTFIHLLLLLQLDTDAQDTGPALHYTTLLPALNKYFKWGKNNTRRQQKTPVLSQYGSGSDLRTETSFGNTTDGACPNSAALSTYFILKGILFLTQQTQYMLPKSLVGFCFVTLRKCVWRGPGQVPMLSTDSPPPPSKYLQPVAGVSVSCAKVCRSRSWIHLPPTTQILMS